MPATDNHHKKTEDHGHSASGIYIHFPFCRSKCPYCSFCSYPEDAARHVYHEYLLGEIDQISNVFQDHFNPVDTIYFGGGTPSLMPVYAVDEILARLRTSLPFFAEWDDIEVSMEFNPEDLDPGYLKDMRDLGVNRISLGFQRMDDEKLKFLHRLHSTEDNINGYKRAREAGFGNISIDLILGLPGDTPDTIRDEIRSVVDLEPEHLSLYLLEIKEGTALAADDLTSLPDDDRLADIYLSALDQLSSSDYSQYEISNFAKEGWESRHNLKYWTGEQWLGLGASSTSCNGKARWKNPEDIAEYLQAVIAIDESFPPQNAETDPSKLMEEEFFMGMRKTEGINLLGFREKWGIDPLEGKGDMISELVSDRFMILEDDNMRLRFTPRGVLVSNEILQKFLR